MSPSGPPKFVPFPSSLWTASQSTGGAIVNSDDFDDRLVSGNCSEMRTSVPLLLAVCLFDGSAFELRLFSYVAIVLHLHT